MFNLVVSNVPGPQQTFYLEGVPLREVFPAVPLNPRNQALSIGIVELRRRRGLRPAGRSGRAARHRRRRPRAGGGGGGAAGRRGRLGRSVATEVSRPLRTGHRDVTARHRPGPAGMELKLCGGYSHHNPPARSANPAQALRSGAGSNRSAGTRARTTRTAPAERHGHRNRRPRPAREATRLLGLLQDVPRELADVRRFRSRERERTRRRRGGERTHIRIDRSPAPVDFTAQASGYTSFRVPAADQATPYRAPQAVLCLDFNLVEVHPGDVGHANSMRFETPAPPTPGAGPARSRSAGPGPDPGPPTPDPDPIPAPEPGEPGPPAI